MIYNRNQEGYPDPTAGAALANICREERANRKHKYERKRKEKKKIKQKRGTESEIKLAYEQLANAVVIRAVEEYRMVLRKCINYPNEKRWEKERLKLEAFFSSSWYRVLTNVDGSMVVDRIREEVGYEG